MEYTVGHRGINFRACRVPRPTERVGETGAHWDTGYSGTSHILEILRKRVLLWPYQINIRETLLPSASYHEGIFTAVNLVRKSYCFNLNCNFVTFYFNFYCAQLFCGTDVI